MCATGAGSGQGPRRVRRNSITSTSTVRGKRFNAYKIPRVSASRLRLRCCCQSILGPALVACFHIWKRGFFCEAASVLVRLNLFAVLFVLEHNKRPVHQDECHFAHSAEYFLEAPQLTRLYRPSAWLVKGASRTRGGHSNLARATKDVRSGLGEWRKPRRRSTTCMRRPLVDY
jgi:hypothetical protein